MSSCLHTSHCLLYRTNSHVFILIKTYIAGNNCLSKKKSYKTIIHFSFVTTIRVSKKFYYLLPSACIIITRPSHALHPKPKRKPKKLCIIIQKKRRSRPSLFNQQRNLAPSRSYSKLRPSKYLDRSSLLLFFLSSATIGISWQVERGIFTEDRYCLSSPLAHSLPATINAINQM